MHVTSLNYWLVKKVHNWYGSHSSRFLDSVFLCISFLICYITDIDKYRSRQLAISCNYISKGRHFF